MGYPVLLAVTDPNHKRRRGKVQHIKSEGKWPPVCRKHLDCIPMTANCCVSVHISLRCVAKRPFDNNPGDSQLIFILVQLKRYQGTIALVFCLYVLAWVTGVCMHMDWYVNACQTYCIGVCVCDPNEFHTSVRHNTGACAWAGSLLATAAPGAAILMVTVVVGVGYEYICVPISTTDSTLGNLTYVSVPQESQMGTEVGQIPCVPAQVLCLDRLNWAPQPTSQQLNGVLDYCTM